MACSRRRRLNARRASTSRAAFARGRAVVQTSCGHVPQYRLPLHVPMSTGMVAKTPHQVSRALVTPYTSVEVLRTPGRRTSTA